MHETRASTVQGKVSLIFFIVLNYNVINVGGISGEQASGGDDDTGQLLPASVRYLLGGNIPVRF